MTKRITAVLGILCLSVACSNKPNTDPSAAARFNSLSARTGRVAAIYVPAALTALPLVAATLKWDAVKQEAARTVLVKVRDSAASISSTLGTIADSAISSEQRVIIGPLLAAIGDGLSELETLGLFSAIENVRVEAGIRVAAMALKTIGALLTQASVEPDDDLWDLEPCVAYLRPSNISTSFVSISSGMSAVM